MTRLDHAKKGVLLTDCGALYKICLQVLDFKEFGSLNFSYPMKIFAIFRLSSLAYFSVSKFLSPPAREGAALDESFGTQLQASAVGTWVVSCQGQAGRPQF